MAPILAILGGIGQAAGGGAGGAASGIGQGLGTAVAGIGKGLTTSGANTAGQWLSTTAPGALNKALGNVQVPAAMQSATPAAGQGAVPNSMSLTGATAIPGNAGAGMTGIQLPSPAAGSALKPANPLPTLNQFSGPELMASPPATSQPTGLERFAAGVNKFGTNVQQALSPIKTAGDVVYNTTKPFADMYNQFASPWGKEQIEQERYATNTRSATDREIQRMADIAASGREQAKIASDEYVARKSPEWTNKAEQQYRAPTAVDMQAGDDPASRRYQAFQKALVRAGLQPNIADLYMRASGGDPAVLEQLLRDTYGSSSGSVQELIDVIKQDGLGGTEAGGKSPSTFRELLRILAR